MPNTQQKLRHVLDVSPLYRFAQPGSMTCRLPCLVKIHMTLTPWPKAEMSAHRLQTHFYLRLHSLRKPDVWVLFFSDLALSRLGLACVHMLEHHECISEIKRETHCKIFITRSSIPASHREPQPNPGPHVISVSVYSRRDIGKSETSVLIGLTTFKLPPKNLHDQLSEVDQERKVLADGAPRSWKESIELANCQ